MVATKMSPIANAKTFEFIVIKAAFLGLEPYFQEQIKALSIP